MWASHSPDFDSRRPHEFENVQIRDCSCSLRIIRVAFLTLGKTFGNIFQPSGETSGEMKKSLACQRIPDGLPDVLGSCVLRDLRVASVWPSCGLRVTSCGLRVAFGFILYFSLPGGNTKLPKVLPKATRIREAFVFTSCVHFTINRRRPEGVRR